MPVLGLEGFLAAANAARVFVDAVGALIVLGPLAFLVPGGGTAAVGVFWFLCLT